MGKVTDAIALLAKRAAAGDEAAADVVAGFTDYAFKVDGVPVSGQQWAYRIGVSDDQGDLIKKAVYDARGDMVKAIENLDRMEKAGMVREPGLSRRFAEGVTSGKYSDLLTNRVTSIGKNAVVAGAAAIAAGTMTPQEAQAGPGSKALAELAKRADAGDEVARQGIRAYHGSPHDFPPVRELEMPDGAVVYQSMDDAVPEGAQVIAEHPLGRFDMSKIGTGEGAQAYGRGLYFAEAEDVAKGYRDSLTDFTELTIKQNGKVVKRGSNLTDDDLEAFKYLEAGLKSAGNFPHNREYYAKQHAERAGASEQVTALIDQYKNAEFSYEKPKGSMYEVDIDATPDDFLDYDKPLSEQSDRVKEALGIKGQQNKLLALQAKSNELQALYDKALSNVPSNQSFDDLFGDSAALRSEGELLTEKNRIDEEIKLLTTPKYFQLGDRKIPIRVQDYFSGANLIHGQGAASEISKQLLDKGIKGIKYLDQGSRAAGKGTSNYVVFDDKLIDITKKYGISIPAAAAVLAGTMTPEEAQASTPQDQQASEYPSLGGMGVRMPPTAEDEEAMLAPTGGDLMQQANRDFAGAIRTQPEPDFLTGVQQSLLSGIMKTAGVADLSADVVSAMAGPLLSAPGAIARYAADRYVPGVNYTAEEMAQGRRETEDYFNYQPRTEQGQQYGEQIMQGIGGAIAPYVPAIKKAAGDSYILGAMRQGYDYLGEREKELAKALMDLSPI
jgi:hypothetical protein